MRTRKLIIAATMVVLSAGMLFASGAVQAVLSGNYKPHRYWYLIRPEHFWTGAIMGTLVRIAYLAIALALLWMANYLRRLPGLRPYRWSVASFSISVVSWVAMRVTETASIWWPAYHLLIGLQIICGAVSVATAITVTAQIPAIAKKLGRFLERLHKKERQVDALRRSKALLDRVGRLIDVGGWEIDLITGKLTWSAEMARILGAPVDYQPVLEEALALYSVEARETLTAAIELASSGGPGWDMELPSFRFDGQPYWIRVVGGVEFERGRPVRVSGASQDITKLVDERLALRTANDRVTLAADSGGIGIWEWDLESKEVICDDWMYRLHGLDRNDGPPSMALWVKSLHPDDRAAMAQSLRATAKGSGIVEFRVIWKDGSVHHLKATGQVTRTRTGRAVRMVGTVWDVTESCRLIGDLAEQHELLRVTLESIGEGVITKDFSRNIVWMNSVAEQMTGWTLTEAVGRPVTHIFTAINEVTRRTEDSHLALFPRGDQAVTSTEPTLLISRDGRECVIESIASPLRNALGDLLGSVLVFRDVTEQRRSAAETERADKLQIQLRLKDEFLSHVSHELRSPLTSIYCFSSIIADELAGETTLQQKSYLEIILKNVVQLQAMIEDLLTVTQSREGKLSFDLQSVSVADAVAEIMSTLQGTAGSKQIALTAVECSLLPPVCADPTRLRQILILLLDNAVKFTPPGGSVTVSAEEGEPGYLLFQVADTGCGIAIGDRGRVFEKLYQVTGPDSCHHSDVGRTGLGLGLHIARDLVSAQGGNIWVSGTHGQGSIFNFTLPIFTEAHARSIPEARLLRRETDFPQANKSSLLPAA